MRKWIVRWTTDGFNIREIFDTKEEAQRYYDKILITNLGLQEIDIWEATPEEEAIAKRQKLGTQLMNAKIELANAINLIDQLYEDGYAKLEECGNLYNIKNQLRDYIEEYRKTVRGNE